MKHWMLAALVAGVSEVALAATELPSIEVESTAPEATTVKTDSGESRTTGGSLGAYLDALPNVDSASYGEGVGRPVVRGMSGYRVKILHNDSEFSDLSAMSPDHAVAVAPRASERIELLKGPASLLYAASAGGVVRIEDFLDAPFPETGLHGEQSLDWRPDPSGLTLDSRLSLANEQWALRLGVLHQDNDPYEADGVVIPDSDVALDQAQLALLWRPSTRSEWQLNATQLEKDYGIPNDTDEATRINMERDDVGLKWRYQPAYDWLDQITFAANRSDYLHEETEDTERNGLFGQDQSGASVALDWVHGEWLGQSRFSAANKTLKVCHEHGACESFTIASRDGGPLGESVEQYLQNTGLPYSHGHPMPNTESDTWQASTTVTRPLSDDLELNLGANWEHRQLSANPENIQQQWVYPSSINPAYYDDRDDDAVSLSAGIKRRASEGQWGWDLSLSHLERLPSDDELYWNGFHHATDSYIFGNPDLDTERSLNLDLDLHWNRAHHYLNLSAFAYRFEGYIYQDPGKDEAGESLIDPFHLSEVWVTRQADSDFVGGAIRYEHRGFKLLDWPLAWWLQYDLLDARLRDGGALPRTSPASAEAGVELETQQWTARATLRHVDKARKLAKDEDGTPGYDLLSLYLERQWQRGSHDISLWLKGDNLTDELAYNHLSFLKDTAPLPGRQLSVGLIWKF